MINKNEQFGCFFRKLSVENIMDYTSLGDSGLYKAASLRMGLMCRSREKQSYSASPERECGGDFYIARLMDGKEEIIKCPFIYFTLPGREIKWSRKNPGRRENFRFDCCGEKADELARCLQKDFPAGYIEISDDAPFRAVLENMRRHTLRTPAEQEYKLPIAAEEFASLFYLCGIRHTYSGKYASEIRQDASEMTRFPGKEYDFSFLASRLKITLPHYRRLFRYYMGIPPHEFLQEKRLALAKELLLSSDHLLLKEISEKCGFGVSSEFCRFFRKREGITPTQYIRSCKE